MLVSIASDVRSSRPDWASTFGIQVGLDNLLAISADFSGSRVSTPTMMTKVLASRADRHRLAETC
jgi:hypothetical protein